MLRQTLSVCVIALLSSSRIDCDGYYGEGIFKKLQTSFEMAGKFLGLDKAESVAKLVSDAFGKSGKKGDEEEGNIFSGFLRIFGFDSKKIGAIAVNAIIFVAQLVRI